MKRKNFLKSLLAIPAAIKLATAFENEKNKISEIARIIDIPEHKLNKFGYISTMSTPGDYTIDGEGKRIIHNFNETTIDSDMVSGTGGIPPTGIITPSYFEESKYLF